VGRLTVVGVRHHSPACARLVRDVIRARRPRHVLIEGPSEMNDRLGELLLPHVLPVAVFTHVARADVRWASWSPFCAYSPEWVALQEGRAAGAEVRFMDLPAWDDAFHAVRNRYADRHDRASRLVDLLCARLGVRDFDGLWDHLFETPMPSEALAGLLTPYFRELRGEDPGDPSDVAREAFMARFVAHARREEGEVVVVCGGFHAPVLERAWDTHPDEPAWPTAPLARAERAGSSVVPYSYHRLDSFTGYEAGMPSPEYQDVVWRDGPGPAVDAMLAAVARRLRGKRHGVSSADLVAARTQAEALGRLRGHPTVLRTDLLDGLAAGLVKDAMEVPLPWTYRGRLRPRTDPLLVEVMATFSGDRLGRLAPGTPLPALVADARQEIERHGLQPRADPRVLELRLADDDDRARSRVLHRLRVLDVPGFERVDEVSSARAEAWQISRSVDAEAALIEAASFGSTLAEAAAARLEERLAGAHGRIAPLSELLGEAILTGATAVSDAALHAAERAAAAEPALGDLGAGLDRLLALWRHDPLFGARGAPLLGAVLAAGFERSLVLAEAMRGLHAASEPSHVEAMRVTRDLLRHAGPALGLDPARAHGVADRMSADPEAPPALRGAAVGLLWSTGFFADPRAGGERAAAALSVAATPRTLGDTLGGLLALARDEVLHAPPLLLTVDGLIADMDEGGFLEALPALRLAFAWLPPGEKEALARAVLRLRESEAPEATPARPLDPALVARAALLEADVLALRARYGLDLS
jgi:hypothetical protein